MIKKRNVEMKDSKNNNKSQNYMNIKKSSIEKEQKVYKKSCSVCYQDYNKKQLICKTCKVCYSCLDNWFTEQLNTQQNDPFISIEQVKLTCPCCRSQKSFDEIEKFQQQFKQTMIKISEISINKNNKFISCPSGTCKNIGYLDRTDCKEQVNCTSCDFKWSIQDSVISKVQNSFKFAEFMTKLFKWFYTKQCPNCYVPIQKVGGCKNMTCANCKKGFCWKCKKASHYNFSFICSSILLLQAVALLFPLNYIIYKLGFYDHLISSINSLFSIDYMIFQYGIISVIGYFMRVSYQIGFFILILLIMRSKLITEKLFFISLLLVNLFCWYYFTRWIEILYYVLFIGQVVLSIFMVYA